MPKKRILKAERRISGTTKTDPAALVMPLLPRTDNSAGAPAALMAANKWWRMHPWPAPYDQTSQTIRIGDALDLSAIGDETVHLVVTSPPYFNLKPYESHASGAQLGRIDDYEAFLAEIDTILDPFAGSGSTALAATKTGRSSISIEIEPVYARMALQKIVLAAKSPRAFGPSRITIFDQITNSTLQGAAA